MKDIHSIRTSDNRHRIRAAVAVIIALSLTACRTPKLITASERIVMDSVRVVETVRDTVVTIEPDSSLIRALIECDSLGQAHLNRLIEYRAGDRMAPPRVEIRDNLLTVAARVDSLSIYLQLKDKYQETVRKEYVNVVRTVEVNRLSGWQRFWLRTGQLSGLLLAACAGFRLWKRIRP